MVTARAMTPDASEFRGTAWFDLDESVDWSAPQFDPHMDRFVAKLSYAVLRRRGFGWLAAGVQ